MTNDSVTFKELIECLDKAITKVNELRYHHPYEVFEALDFLKDELVLLIDNKKKENIPNDH